MAGICLSLCFVSILFSGFLLIRARRATDVIDTVGKTVCLLVFPQNDAVEWFGVPRLGALLAVPFEYKSLSHPNAIPPPPGVYLLPHTRTRTLHTRTPSSSHLAIPLHRTLTQSSSNCLLSSLLLLDCGVVYPGTVVVTLVFILLSSLRHVFLCRGGIGGSGCWWDPGGCPPAHLRRDRD